MENDEEAQLQEGFALLLVGLLAVSAPLVLLPLRLVTSSFVGLEELMKLLLVGYLVRQLGDRAKRWQALTIGVLFGLTETILYVMNASVVGVYEGLLLRSVTTVPMHALTPVVMLAARKRYGRVGWGVGLLVAILVHALFNYLVG